MMSYTPTHAEKQELQDIQAYLRQHAQSDFRHMPEKTIAAVMNRASPAVREHMARNKDMVDHVLQGGRSEPFQPRIEMDWNALDKATEAIAAKARTEEVTHGLLSRMGTDTSAPEPSGPPDLREALTASFDHHEGSTND